MSVWLWVSVPHQRLYWIDNGIIAKRYPISTAAKGLGESYGSERTPRGWHVIRAKIGAGLPRGAVLVGRRFTGEIHSPEMQAESPNRDWILSRILWLSGLEPGFNRLGPVDTFRRYIYIHGSPDHLIDGLPRSHGCIRMRSDDVIDLFDRVSIGTRVFIGADRQSPSILSSPPPK